MRYRVPAGLQRTEVIVVNSRFIATVGPAETPEAARQFLARIRAEMPDASHHVYAFRAGYGNSITEGMSDDGEPSGTSGPPILAILRGTDIGDIIVVVTRYFGGTKLGTGGLVRAYSGAARAVLEILETNEKTEAALLGIECPYPLYENLKRLIADYEGQIDDEDFTAAVTLFVTFPVDRIEAFTAALRELSNGRVEPVRLSGEAE